MTPKKTSWGAVAGWYDELIEDSPDSYQKKVLMPNVIRIVDPKAGMTIVDVACGQGYFTRAFAENGAQVLGSDISPELIRIAQANETAKQTKILADKTTKGLPERTGSTAYHVASADKLSFAADGSADVITIVLALQNIENLLGTLVECGRVVKKGGRVVLILNHPAFRIPQHSSWQWDEKMNKQYRRIDSYMSDQQFKIDMTPGEINATKKKFTVSFHRPLQSYFKALNKAGFAVTRLEEWISHKKSQAGPRAAEEDRTRKEIPMFICFEAQYIK